MLQPFFQRLFFLLFKFVRYESDGGKNYGTALLVLHYNGVFLVLHGQLKQKRYELCGYKVVYGVLIVCVGQGKICYVGNKCCDCWRLAFVKNTANAYFFYKIYQKSSVGEIWVEAILGTSMLIKTHNVSSDCVML